MEKQLYIVTGGPGFGKTLIIEELKKRSYQTFEEAARGIIKEQILKNGNILPSKDYCTFQKTVLERRKNVFMQLNQGLNFTDRGIIDQIGYSLYHGWEPNFELLDAANKAEYEKVVFITPPWEEIYRTDLIRKEGFDEASFIHECIIRAYASFDYQLIEIPKLPVYERADFILNHIKNL